MKPVAGAPLAVGAATATVHALCALYAGSGGIGAALAALGGGLAAAGLVLLARSGLQSPRAALFAGLALAVLMVPATWTLEGTALLAWGLSLTGMALIGHSRAVAAGTGIAAALTAVWVAPPVGLLAVGALVWTPSRWRWIAVALGSVAFVMLPTPGVPWPVPKVPLLAGTLTLGLLLERHADRVALRQTGRHVVASVIGGLPALGLLALLVTHARRPLASPEHVFVALLLGSAALLAAAGVALGLLGLLLLLSTRHAAKRWLLGMTLYGALSYPVVGASGLLWFVPAAATGFAVGSLFLTGRRVVSPPQTL